MVGRKKTDEKYPDSDYPTLTPAEDPDMVRLAGGNAVGALG